MVQSTNNPKAKHQAQGGVTRRDAFALAPAGALLAAGAVGGATVLAPTSALAAAAKQAPAFHRRRVGEAIVTAIGDGYIEMKPEFWPGTTEEEIAAAKAAGIVPVDQPLFSSINAHVIEVGGKTIAVDAGSADLFGDVAGHYLANLDAAGIDPKSVDMVFATHFHPDHIGGLIIDGANIFPNAELVASQVEYEFWTSETNKANAPDAFKSLFDLAIGVTKVYDGKTKLVGGDDDLGNGLSAVSLAGHTPGHTGIMIDSGGSQMMLWSDVCHNVTLQLPEPTRGISFDADPEAAAQTRIAAFDRVSADKLMVAGAHLPFPGFGFISKEAGVYRYHPAPWDHRL